MIGFLALAIEVVYTSTTFYHTSNIAKELGITVIQPIDHSNTSAAKSLVYVLL